MSAARKPAKIPGGLGLGCWEFSDIGSGPPSDERSIEIIRTALSLGVRHFDTAQDYGDGHSERVLGRAIASVPGGIFVATKTHAAGRADTISRVEESLARLGRSSADLFYVHWPHRGVDLRPMMEALEELRSRGLIRLIGVSNFGVEEMALAGEACRIDVHQLCYNLLWRFPEREVIPYCRENGIEIVTYSSIAQGLLSDTPRSPEAFDPGDARRRTVYYRDDVWPRLREAVDAMRSIARRASLPLSTLAIRWLLGRPGVAGVLVGARSVEQLRSNVEAASGGLDPATEGELDLASAEAMRHIPDVGNIFLFYP